MLSGKNCNPTKNGWYVLIQPNMVSDVMFTVEGGWNTHYGFDGELHDEYDYEPDKPFVWFEKDAYIKEVLGDDGEN